MTRLADPFRPYCRRCEDLTDHTHDHDTAHGIEATHMMGSERFTCDVCGLVTHASDEGEYHFIFQLDRPRRLR